MPPSIDLEECLKDSPKFRYFFQEFRKFLFLFSWYECWYKHTTTTTNSALFSIGLTWLEWRAESCLKNCDWKGCDVMGWGWCDVQTSTDSQSNFRFVVLCLHWTKSYISCRYYLVREEAEIEHLEQRLEKIIKACTIAVDSGKEYVKNQR